MAEALNAEVEAILASASAPAELGKFLLNNALTTVSNVALLAADENRLEDKVFPVMGKGGVDVDVLKNQVAVKQVWLTCRKAMSDNTKINTDNAKEADILPQVTRENLAQSWLKEHKFVISGERLLREETIKTLYVEIHATPPKFSIHFMENLRMQSALQATPKLAVPKIFKPGEPIVVEEVVADEVCSAMQIYERGRAFAHTLAYVCIGCSDMFSYQDVIFLDDKLLELVQWTRDGRRPPVSHLTAAWAQTMRFLSDELRTSRRKLSVLVRETASWTSYWTSWSPPATSTQAHPSAHGHTDVGSARIRELEGQLAGKKSEAARYQSQLHALRQSHRSIEAHDLRERSPLRSGKGDRGDRGENRGNKGGKGDKGGKGGKGGKGSGNRRRY